MDRRRFLPPKAIRFPGSPNSRRVLALAACLSPGAAAQMHHTEAPQKVTRAVGVYEWTGDLLKPSAARFVPVSLFIDGHIQDAGLYLARPVPLALQPGDIYAVERAGEPTGTLDLDLAHRVVTGKALADDNPAGAWYGFGKFTPEAAPKITPLHPSSHPSKLESSAGPASAADAKTPETSSGDRPHMNRRDARTGTPDSTDNSQGGSGSSTGSTTGSSSGSGSPSTTSAGGGTGSTDDDVDRPTLRRRDPAQDAARRKDTAARSKTASVTAAGPALGDDPDRPILGHNTESTSIPELTGLPADLHQAAAVSDAAHVDTHPFARAWESPAEHTETLGELEKLARIRMTEYLATNGLVASNAPLPAPDTANAVENASRSGTAPNATTPQAAAASNAAAGSSDPDAAAPKLQRGVPKAYAGGSASGTPASAAAHPTATSSTPTAKSSTQSNPAATASGSQPAAAPRPAPSSSTRAGAGAHRTAKPPATHNASLALGQGEVHGFILSYGGLPTFVYTAAASVTPVKSETGPASPRAAYVTVVAQRLPSGELQVALSDATDSAHLDRGPRLRLIDAVDPDDSHRASLLFELRAASSRQFALYRLTSVHAEQIFTTASLE